jgi:2-polyprenyl-3-methyl-5-hydroxy-6-metoxy-1,4-benzoquinol methylase
MMGDDRTVALCACCGATDWRTIVGGELTYRHCRVCGHEILLGNDALSKQDRFETEQQKHYDEDSVCAIPLFSALQTQASRRRIAEMRRHLPAGRLLEIGPGSGETLTCAREVGYEIDAVEHSEHLAGLIRDRLGLSVRVGAFEDLDIPPASYDAYLSFHVIEHVTDVAQHLRKAAEVVRPGGFAFIATPNAASWENRLPFGLSPNFSTAHFQLFSPKSLGLCLEQAGWRVVQTSTFSFVPSWIRVATAVVRRAKGSKQAVARGGYMKAASSKTATLTRVVDVATAPLRFAQERIGSGNELFIIAQKTKPY